MLIHNATFMVEPRRGAEFLEWFTPLAHKAGPEGRSHLSVMRPEPDQALSVAFQVEFETLEEVEDWVSRRLRPLAAAFERHYAPEAMIFTSVFERIF